MLNRMFAVIILLLPALLSLAQKPEIRFDIPIFAYHRFGDARYPSTNIELKVFEEQLKFLDENEFTVLTFGDAVSKWKNGDSFPEKPVILTVDDGYSSFYAGAFPLLKKYGFAATVFIQTGTIGGGDFMAWDHIKEIQQAGIEIGNHSDSHAYFVNLSEEERKSIFQSDFETASAAFEKHLGVAPVIYAYPYGEWDKGMEEVLRQEKVMAAAVQKSGVFCETSNPMAIPRFPMGGPFATMNGFKNKLQMKALRITEQIPDDPFLPENPPTLIIKPIPSKINTKQAQFFIDGRKSDNILITLENDIPVIKVFSPGKLTDRRTLYTITAPSLDGGTWHWYSNLWIRPELKEK